mgnify:CR=1 FL=1
MGKHILLIGVSAGELATENLERSPAIANVTALKQTLLADVDELRDDQIITLINPNLRQMRHAIALMTYRCRHGDLCLIYYTGCGVIDTPTGTLYLPASDTQLDNIPATAISSDYIRYALPSLQTGLSRVMILDCLWGNLPPRPDNTVDDTTDDTANDTTDDPAMGTSAIGEQPSPHLADCNCALLTALGSTTHPWPITDTGLSLYTHCLIEGITTGLADIDADGGISTSDLQTYMAQTLGKAELDIFPIALGEADGHVPLFTVPPYSPEREYRRSVEEYAKRHQGHIPPASRSILEFLRHQLGITFDQSQAIETEVMTPYTEHRENCDRYRHAFAAALELETPLGKPLKKWLRHLQGELFLSYKDVSSIEAQVLSPQAYPQLQTLPQWLTPVDTVPKLPAHSREPNGHRSNSTTSGKQRLA